ncbi:hypothetical protein MMC22_002980, partial [Lobaria immixta]|nr:hypothetical protein [Lobaria immixta]
MATASSQAKTKTTQEIPKTLNLSKTSHLESTELASLQAQRDNARHLRIKVEMASMHRQININLAATQALQSNNLSAQSSSQTLQAENQLFQSKETIFEDM